MKKKMSIVVMARPRCAAGARGAKPVHLRANAAFAACLESSVAAFGRTGHPVVMDVGEPDPINGADLVVGDDTEMTRLLEGGTADLASAVDLGYLPWVARARRAGVSAQSIRPGSAWPCWADAWAPRPPVGVALGPAAVRRSARPRRAARARWALVPRSLAGAGTQRPAPVRPLVATAAVIPASRVPRGHARRCFPS